MLRLLTLGRRLRSSSLTARQIVTPVGLLVALVIAVLGVCGLLGLNRLAEDAHTAEIVLTRLELQIARAHSWDRRAVNGQSGSDELPIIQGRSTDLTLSARQLDQVASMEPSVADLVSAMDAYRAVLDEEIERFEAGDTEGTAAVQHAKATPRYAVVAATLPPAQTAVRDRAARVSMLVAGGSVATMLVSLLAIGVVVWGIERARRATERRGETRFRSLVQNATDLVAIVDADTTLRYASPAADTLLGVAPEVAVGTSLAAYAHPDDEPLVRRALDMALADPRANVTETFRVTHPDGLERHVEATWRDLRHEEGIAGIVLNVRDVSERKTLEAELAYRAFHDELTDLPNRSFLVERLRHVIAAETHPRRGGAVVFIDLDDFKLVNDGLGHNNGDLLLVMVAQRLRSRVRPEDMVARLGGDEFIVLLEGVADAAEAVAAAERCREALRAPFAIEGHELFVGASIGVASIGPESTIPEELLRQADLAMYAAKSRGKSQLAVFEPALHTSSVDRMQLQTDLQRALERNELRLHYQPIVDLRTGRISSVEALLRWQHPHRGLVSPDQFIPLAEQTGLIIPIGQWVLHEACRQARVWQTQRGGGPCVSMGVNLSGRQFQHSGLVEGVAAALADTGLPAACLTLEITESVAMEDGAATVETLQALKSLGVHLAIDDFGTGYSSLSYLKRFPVDTLKIDRAFVDGLGRDAQDTAIVRTVIALARSLELAVTAEGVETIEQLAELEALGCDEGQGFYFSRPRPAEALGPLLADTLLLPREYRAAA